MRLCGRHDEHGQALWIDVHDGVISDTGALPGVEPGTLPWIAPGLVDLQVNGFGGEEFTDQRLTVEAVQRISVALDRDGVTKYLPTIVTHSAGLHEHVLRTIAEAIDPVRPSDGAWRVYTWKGPTSPQKTGRVVRTHANIADHQIGEEFQRLQDAARGHIRLVTLSPEYSTAPDFIRRVVATGTVVSIGHTNANATQIEAAVEAGARMSTHLGNGAHAFVHRHSNYIWEQLADDRLTATLIADGHHLPPAVLKCFVRGKTPSRVVLISDITGLAGAVGTTPGCHEHASLGQVEVLANGRVVVAGQREYLAGATLPLHVGVANVCRFADASLAAAIDMASTRPASLLSCPSGRLETGAVADLMQFQLRDRQPGLHIIATINAGECVYGRVVGETREVPEENDEARNTQARRNDE